MKKCTYRVLIAFVTMTFFCTFGCTSFQPVPTTDITANEGVNLVGKDVKLYTADGRVHKMTVTKVDFPFLEGEPIPMRDPDYPNRFKTTSGGRVDLREVQRIEIRSPDRRKTVLLGVVVVGVLVLVIVSIVVNPEPSGPGLGPKFEDSVVSPPPE